MPPGVATDASADPAAGPDFTRLTEAIDALLPQTQCERCGHPGCLPYARAIASGRADINRCAPGGRQTIVALAGLLGRPIAEPASDCPPIEGRQMARIDAAACIGCVKCVLACPVDAIVGAARHRHQVLVERCTGCALCLPPCPVDCIRIEPFNARWTPVEADRARSRHAVRNSRLAGGPAPTGSEPTQTKRRRAATDPLQVLADPAERARRLAGILARAAAPRPPR